ncbi:hypothetical protein BpHYR1_012088 [Brachionus plicatilis]|uniref:Uncharacterized protein n=1 Tax=Brachionus plicatilis TaxID=10195 RepID=A0A3M7SS85_BRAPC|nr:hypothetical protein BpHYR1_012088 [Brachionus plicatilis]
MSSSAFKYSKNRYLLLVDKLIDFGCSATELCPMCSSPSPSTRRKINNFFNVHMIDLLRHLAHIENRSCTILY